MKYKEIKKKWNKLTEGWFGNVIYLFLGFVIAYSFNVFLGYALNTDTPVVAVFSCSMEHNTYNNWFCNIRSDEVCGKNINGYDTTNFDDYWRLCGGWYESQNISKEKFNSFIFKDGLEVGDMVIVLNTKSFNVGDILIFDTDLRKYPIIHRISAINDNTILTKGDNNAASDSFSKTKINGKAILRIPLLGWVKILFTEATGIA
jgi:signal peptidase I